MGHEHQGQLGETRERTRPLVVTFFPHNPYPPRTGAHYRCMQVITGLMELGCDVVLCSSTLFSETPWDGSGKEGLLRTGLADVRIYEPRRADTIFCGLLSRFYRFSRASMPLDSLYYTPLGLRLWFTSLLRGLNPDIVLINYAYWDALAWRGPRGALRVIDYYDILSQNREMRRALESLIPQPPIRSSEIGAEVLEEDFFSALEYPQQEREFRIFDKYDYTLCIAAREASWIEEHTDHTRLLFIPITREPVYLANTYDGPALFPTGPNPFNLQGFYYLVRNVLPLVRKEIETLSVLVTGSCCELVMPEEGVELAGHVPDIADLYTAARYMVCPVFGGTGQQIKIVEAMAHGVPVIALRRAAEATPLQHGVSGWVADDASSFAEGMIRLWLDQDLCRRLGEAARETVKECYSRERLLDALSPLLDGITTFESSRRPHGQAR